MVLSEDVKSRQIKTLVCALVRKLISPNIRLSGVKAHYNYWGIILIMVCIATSCKKPYSPAIVNSDNSYLVVEGMINSSNDSTIISLSRTVKIADSAHVNPATGYTVTVEAEGGSETYKLKQLTSCKYGTAAMLLNGTKKYRLHMVAPDGREYASEYLEVLNNPPIDSLSFKPKASTLDIFASTHDPENKIKYYRWEYEEDWKFHANVTADFIADKAGDSIRKRKPEEQIYYCFSHDKSSDIRLGTTDKLNQAVLSEGLVASIPTTSEKISVQYSILVKQYALTRGAYEFWDNLSKNTEKLGSIFDAQPSLLKGNITCISDPAEPVIGYLTASNTQVKRIFIYRFQLPKDWVTPYPFDCAVDKAYFSAPVTGQNQVKDFLIDKSEQFIPIQFVVIGYLYTSPRCADCSIRGKLSPPSFWK